MLLEFRVSNYRSIRDEQCLSLMPVVADTALKVNNVHVTNSNLVPEVLNGCAVYGANASGKSNLFRAMGFMQALVKESATAVKAGQALNVQSFAFDKTHPSSASSFELTALIDGVRYQYGFSLTANRIQDEWLLVFKSSKPQEWFSRKWNETTKQHEYAPFSAYFVGQKDLWKRSTRENALFLSTAVQFNSEQLRPLWNWIVNSWINLPAMVPLNMNITLNAIEHVQTKKAILEFLNAADLGIADISIVKAPGKEALFAIDGATGNASVSESKDTEIRMPRFTHVASQQTVALDYQDESQGTQRLFEYAGIILMILQNGMTLAIDEIESSMHPLLVRHILKLFFSPETNPHGAQIIFTTHSTTLLDNELLRRDQIWFTEKDADLATALIAFSEFSPRKNESFEKNYLEGRYGAIPILRTFQAKEAANARE